MTTRPNLIRIPHKRWPTEIWRSVRNHAMRSHPEVDQHTRQYVLETLDLLHAQSGSFEEQNYLEIERSLDRAIGNLKGLPFIVVDANGGGNYKTLATAVAAVPAGDAALIIITNGGGNFDTITVNTGSQIYVMMSQPSANPLLSGNVVTLDHITSGGTGSLVAFVDCNVNFSNATSLDNGYTGAIWFLNCPFVSSTSAGANLANGGSNTFYGVNTLFSIGSQTGAMNNYGTAAFVNCNFTKLFSDTAAVASIQLTNCVIQALASFQTTNITVAMGGAGTVVQFNNCTIGLPTSTHSFGITFNASTSSTQVWQFADCTFNTPGTTTIAVTSMNDGSSFVVTGCRFQQRAHSVVFTLATTGKSTIEFSGNDAQMVTVTQTGHTDTNMHISGVYQKISIATNGAVVDAVLNLQATGGPGVTISGDGALVMASFQNGSGASTGLSISGNNAICFLTNTAAVTTPFSNSGSNNNINNSLTLDQVGKNLLPAILAPQEGVIYPAGGNPVGGSLAGTLPNPTFSGRDASVDKINQDLLPALLASPNGVQTLPGPFRPLAVSVTSNQVGFTTAFSDVTGATITAVLSSLRRYQISWTYGAMIQRTNPGIPVCAILAGATQIAQGNCPSTAVNGQGANPCFAFIPGNDTSTIYKVQCLTTVSTCDLAASANSPAYLAIVDVGPA